MARHKLFISYSHEDKRWLKRVRQQLAVLEGQGLIDAFEDTQIGAGADWCQRLDQEMAEAKIALLLISASFLGSSFILKEEIPRLMERHKSDGMELYPLLVRDCPWQEVGWLSRLNMRPVGPRAIAQLRGGALDTSLADVAREIASIVRRNPSSPPARPRKAGSPVQTSPILPQPTPRELLVYRTKQQRIYLKVSDAGIECHVEDERPERKGHRWTISKAEASRILRENDILADPNYTENSGRFTIGKRRDWRYSKKLFPEPSLLEQALRKLLESAAS
jgi:hypothetical protein